MSCYFRHMKDVFAEAGIEITPDNKRDVDRAVHKIAGIEYKDCPTTWKTLKARFLSDEKKRAEFVRKLKKAVA
jgi:hypothetical protein